MSRITQETARIVESEPVIVRANQSPPPLATWARRRPMIALWYAVSRLGDHGRLLPFRRLTRITGHVYLGGQIDRRGWRLVQSWGVSAVISLRVEWDDRRSGIDTPHLLWLPTIDSTPPTIEQLARGVAFIHEQVQHQRAVYVHCAGGLGRSPTLVIAYLMTRGTPFQDAINYVMARRPFIQLSARQKQRMASFYDYIQEHGLDYSSDTLIDPPG